MTRSKADMMTPTFDAFAQMQQTGFKSMMETGTAWAETMGDFSSEVGRFVAQRLADDMQTQASFMACTTPEELQHAHAQFIQRALDQYHIETGKLVEMGNRVIARTAKGTQTE